MTCDCIHLFADFASELNKCLSNSQTTHSNWWVKRTNALFVNYGIHVTLTRVFIPCTFNNLYGGERVLCLRHMCGPYASSVLIEIDDVRRRMEHSVFNWFFLKGPNHWVLWCTIDMYTNAQRGVYIVQISAGFVFDWIQKGGGRSLSISSHRQSIQKPSIVRQWISVGVLFNNITIEFVFLSSLFSFLDTTYVGSIHSNSIVELSQLQGSFSLKILRGVFSRHEHKNQLPNMNYLATNIDIILMRVVACWCFMN